jgi:hypothetical protein
MEDTMPPTDEPPSFASESAAPSGRRPKAPSGTPDQQAAATLVSVNVDTTTGRVVSVESLDASGDRHELSDDERSRLTQLNPETTLRDIVERAFEAGVSSVLGQRAGEEETPESEEDAELSRMLLRSLIGQSAAKRLMQFDVLGPAIVGTLMERAASHRDLMPEASSAH